MLLNNLYQRPSMMIPKKAPPQTHMHSFKKVVWMLSFLFMLAFLPVNEGRQMVSTMPKYNIIVFRPVCCFLLVFGSWIIRPRHWYILRCFLVLSWSPSLLIQTIRIVGSSRLCLITGRSSRKNNKNKHYPQGPRLLVT